MSERKRLGLSEVRDLQPGREVWDPSVPGFGARRQQSSAVAYVLLYRTREGRKRRLTIGRHGAPWTPDTARAEARRILGEVSQGNDPAADKRANRTAMTVSQLCDAYMDDAEGGRLLTRRGAAKKDSTLASDKGRIERHIKPLLGHLPVRAVAREDVEAFMHSVAAGDTAKRTKLDKKFALSNVRGGRGVATRSVGLLGAIFTYAERKRLRTDNPVRGVTRFADGQRQRRLSDDEYLALGKALRLADEKKIWLPAVAAARFLLLTGWRSGEALGLKWSEVDLARRTAILPDTKTGRSIRPLSQPACDVLTKAPKLGELVFAPTRGDGRMSGFPSIWERIAKLGEISDDVTPHVLRHSFASVAGDLGYSEPTIAALIGHTGQSMTSRYVHAADAVLLAAADRVAGEILGRMATSACS